MLTTADGEPYDLHQAVMVVAVEPPTRLIDLRGHPQSWDTVTAHAALWHDRRRRSHAPREMRADLGLSRGLRITEAGRAYLAALRAGQA